MKHLKRFNELNIAGTYLDKANIPKTDVYTSGTKKSVSDFFSKKGKVFKDEPTTASAPVLKFEVQAKSGNKTSYRILFPSNFLDQDTDTGMYNLLDFTDAVKVPIKELLENMFIVTEGEFNRIHFTTFADQSLPASDGVPKELRGIGLGYLIYENLIKHLGFASSNNNHTSSEAASIWNKIAGDPDFYGLFIKSEGNKGYVMVFYRDAKIDVEKIASKFILDNVNSNCTEIRIDDELMKLPGIAELKNKFDSFPKDEEGIKTNVSGVSYEPFNRLQ